LPGSSNVTLLVELTLGDARALAVYKPARGERPLWDFPPGLFKREIAAWHLSEALGWALVPRTIHRVGPFGEGALQQFVAADFDQHYFTLREDETHHARLRSICAFDLVANNADRKSGHCLLAPDGAIYAIDNGLCFHVEPKLRTVIWDFVDEPIPEALLEDLRRLGPNLASGPLRDRLQTLLTPAEIDAIAHRVADLMRSGRFPEPGPGRPYPWPVV